MDSADKIPVDQRLAAIEAKLDLVLARLGVGEDDVPPDVWGAQDADPVLEAIRAGMKIKAITLYREHTGVGLKDAKAAVDAMIAELRRNGERV